MQEETEFDDYKTYMENQLKPGWQVVHFTLWNKSSHPLTIIAEPWGTQVIVPSGEECQVLSEEPNGHATDVTFSDDYVQFWAGRNMEIFQDGEGYGVTGEYAEWQQQWRSKNK